jgi:threonine synthase
VPRLAVINAKGARTLDRLVNDIGVKWTPAPDGDELAGTFDEHKVAAEWARLDAAGAAGQARTIASAIEINRPVNFSKALRALWAMNGVVRSVDDQTILRHKAMIGRFGFGCEPASAASLAGAHLLLQEGVIQPDKTVVCILTGHQLKDPDATVAFHMKSDDAAREAGSRPLPGEPNHPIRVADDLDAIRVALSLG